MTWTNRVWAEFHSGNLTRGFRDVLLTLATYRGTGGVAWPSHASLAARARCCARTVQRALATAAELGLVTWTERRVRAGWRWLRTSNLYRFTVPAEPVTAHGTAVSSKSANVPFWRKPLGKPTAGQTSRGSESKKVKKEALATFLASATDGPDLLARRRQAMEARWRAAAN